ncbi:MAG: dinitrogenase iron-molybdenum cofactor biosynthesis protein [Rhodospirillales bacterium]|nr:dinitrogenase iron-molybdenum cofactor biosynthesis protein [Rhodospirillales bacterium]
MGTVAVSSRGPELDSQLEPRFGRAAGFIIIDPKTMEYRYLDNALGCALATGAGIYAAEALVRSGVRVIITGSPGPKALRALSAAGIRIVQSPGGKTVREAVDSFRDTEMSALDETQNRA